VEGVSPLVPHLVAVLSHGADPGDLGAYLLAVLWPPWFIAKCLGVRWIIAIERNGRERRAGARLA